MQLKKALERATRLTKESSNFSLAWMRRGILEYELGLWSSAKRDIRHAFNLQQSLDGIQDWLKRTVFAASVGIERPNHYQTLQVLSDCEQKDVRRAFHKRALKVHPDKVPTSERAQAEIDFKQLHLAYETLVEPDRREAYDWGT